jgi:hypothetical protein
LHALRRLALNTALAASGNKRVSAAWSAFVIRQQLKKRPVDRTNIADSEHFFRNMRATTPRRMASPAVWRTTCRAAKILLTAIDAQHTVAQLTLPNTRCHLSERHGRRYQNLQLPCSQFCAFALAP